MKLRREHHCAANGYLLENPPPVSSVLPCSYRREWSTVPILWSPTKAEEIEVMEIKRQPRFTQDFIYQCSLISTATFIKMEDSSNRVFCVKCFFWKLLKNEQFLLKLKAGSISDMAVTIATSKTSTTLEFQWQTPFRFSTEVSMNFFHSRIFVVIII